MIKLLIVCLLVSIGFVPCSMAYSIVEAPPVERKSKKSKIKKIKFRKLKKEKKIKKSLGLLLIAVVIMIPGVLIIALSSNLGILILGLVFLLIALGFAIASLIITGMEKQKEKDNNNNGGSSLGNSSKG